jgi:ubiquitin carboxyl-terminal hydrolase L3
MVSDEPTIENNPEVMTDLALQLGISPNLTFHDVYSFDDPGLLSIIPRPAYALLVIIPLTPTWNKFRKAEDESRVEYNGSGEQEPVVWFKQTIGNACGLYALLHCMLNGIVPKMITPGSELERLLKEAVPLDRAGRANLLESSEALEAAHQAAARKGDTAAPEDEELDHLGMHFVAFVKGRDGHLWELEGSRKGPLDRGLLGDEDDALSEKALDLGFRRYIKMEKDAGGKDLRFSCIALVPKLA